MTTCYKTILYKKIFCHMAKHLVAINIGTTLLFSSFILQKDWLGHCHWLKYLRPIHRVLKETKEGIYNALTKKKVYNIDTRK
jgi:hypothetical protein